MVAIDCPSCDQPLDIDLAYDAELRCDGCLVRVELAPDPDPRLVAVAA